MVWKTTYSEVFRMFRRKCSIRRDDNDLGKYDTRADKGIFLGYTKNKAY